MKRGHSEKGEINKKQMGLQHIGEGEENTPQGIEPALQLHDVGCLLENKI